MASYIIRNIDPSLWADVKARAAAEERPLRAVLLRLLRLYVRGPSLDAVDPVLQRGQEDATRDAISSGNTDRVAAKGTV